MTKWWGPRLAVDTIHQCLLLHGHYGYPDGLEITLDAPAGRYQGDKEIAEALGGQWQRASFKPKVQVAEWGAYFKQFQDAYVLGLGGPMQDADELYNLVSSKGRGLYYKNERVDTLFDLGRSTMDQAKRRQIYRDLQRAMVDDATWVFLLQQVDIYATRDRLTWTPRPDQWMPLQERCPVFHRQPRRAHPRRLSAPASSRTPSARSRGRPSDRRGCRRRG